MLLIASKPILFLKFSGKLPIEINIYIEKILKCILYTMQTFCSKAIF